MKALFFFATKMVFSVSVFYISLFQNNIIYVRRLQAHVCRSYLRSVVNTFVAGRYLILPHWVADGMLDQDDFWIGCQPNFDWVPSPARGADRVMYRPAADAFRRSDAIVAKDQSLLHLYSRRHWLAAHAVTFDGFTWQVRACGSAYIGASTHDELDCSKHVALKIGLHPAPYETQANVISHRILARDCKANTRTGQALKCYAPTRIWLCADPVAKKMQGEKIGFFNRECTMEGLR